MKKTIVSMLALSALVFSCKKDDDKSTSEQILGKWNITSVYLHAYDNGASNRDTLTYTTPVETIEFKNDGTAIHTINYGSLMRDTGIYEIKGSTLILDKTDSVTINKISGSDLQLYLKENYGSNEYQERWINYKK